MLSMLCLIQSNHGLFDPGCLHDAPPTVSSRPHLLLRQHPHCLDFHQPELRKASFYVWQWLKEAETDHGLGGSMIGFNKEDVRVEENRDESDNDLAQLVHDFIENGSSCCQQRRRRRNHNDFLIDDSDTDTRHSSAPTGFEVIQSSLLPQAILQDMRPVEKEVMSHLMELLANASEATLLCLGEGCKGGCLERLAVRHLRMLGFQASICKPKWRSNGKLPGGKYRFIEVRVEGEEESGKRKAEERVIVDMDFRSQFEIARPMAKYTEALQLLPLVFVGGEGRLDKVLGVMSEAAKKSLRKSAMHLPPWRTLKYLRSKWQVRTASSIMPSLSMSKSMSLSSMSSSSVSLSLNPDRSKLAHHQCNQLILRKKVKGSNTEDHNNLPPWRNLHYLRSKWLITATSAMPSPSMSSSMSSLISSSMSSSSSLNPDGSKLGYHQCNHFLLQKKVKGGVTEDHSNLHLSWRTLHYLHSKWRISATSSMPSMTLLSFNPDGSKLPHHRCNRRLLLKKVKGGAAEAWQALQYLHSKRQISTTSSMPSISSSMSLSSMSPSSTPDESKILYHQHNRLKLPKKIKGDTKNHNSYAKCKERMKGLKAALFSTQ